MDFRYWGRRSGDIHETDARTQEQALRRCVLKSAETSRLPCAHKVAIIFYGMLFILRFGQAQRESPAECPSSGIT